MYKLGALDAGFLYNETARSPQHIASVQILALPENVNEAEYVAQVKSLLMERIHLVPYFTNKLKFVPFNLDHPVWVKDHAFSIITSGRSQYLHRVIVPPWSEPSPLCTSNVWIGPARCGISGF